MSVDLKNFEAASRKPMMESFGMMRTGADLTWVAANVVSTAPKFEDLSATIVGGAGQTFTLTNTPGTSVGSVDLRWNTAPLAQNIGYTISGVTITMAAGYEPQVGDVLVAYVWE
jgi:hypothetical protein